MRDGPITVVASIAVTVACLILAECKAAPVPPPPNIVTADKRNPPAPPPNIRDDPACKLFKWPLPPAQAAVILKQTATFADTGIYIGGEPPPQMAAFNVLLDQPDATLWFDDIARSGSQIGRLYALCAFQVLDTARAAMLAAQLRVDEGNVFTQFGCTGMQQAISKLVDAIEKYSYGTDFREARDRTYKYFNRPANICMRRSGGA